VPKPIIGITIGDPAGIGPEIVAKALAHPRVHAVCRPLVFGTGKFLKQFVSPDRIEFVGVEHPLRPAFMNAVQVVETPAPNPIRLGKHDAASGKIALAYIDHALAYAARGKIKAIVTAPVSKAAIRKAGNPAFTGHTEYLVQKTGTGSFAMMFYSKRFLVSLVTTHLPLREVADAITQDKILDVICLSHAAAQKFGKPNPRIGVAGLNPHAGESGALGREDQLIIAPAVRRARQKKMDVEGPIPADVLFRKAYLGDFDIVIAMYHDQALAPFKMISFERGVNITLGLPFVRTSVDHGTAADIAGKGVASEASMLEAIKIAVQLTK